MLVHYRPATDFTGGRIGKRLPDDLDSTDFTRVAAIADVHEKGGALYMVVQHPQGHHYSALYCPDPEALDEAHAWAVRQAVHAIHFYVLPEAVHESYTLAHA